MWAEKRLHKLLSAHVIMSCDGHIAWGLPCGSGVFACVFGCRHFAGRRFLCHGCRLTTVLYVFVTALIANQQCIANVTNRP